MLMFFYKIKKKNKMDDLAYCVALFTSDIYPLYAALKCYRSQDDGALLQFWL